MKIQTIAISTLIIVSALTASISADAKGSSGGGSRSGSSSSSSRSSFSSGGSSKSSFGSSSSTKSSSTSSSSNSKPSSASAFSRGPSQATKAVAVSKAQSLNTSSKPLSKSELSASGVKQSTPQALGMSSSDTSKLTSMQASHNQLQSIPQSQRNSSNPEYVRLEQNYNRDRVVFIQSYPTTYIPVYGSSYGPYEGGQVRYVQPADDNSGLENFLNFIGKVILFGLAGAVATAILVAIYSFCKEELEVRKAEKIRKENEQKRF